MSKIKDISCEDGVITVTYCDGTTKQLCGTVPGEEGTVGDYPDDGFYADAPGCYIAREVSQEMYSIMTKINTAIQIVPDGLLGSGLATAAVVAALQRRAGDYPLLLVPVTFANSSQEVGSAIEAAYLYPEFAKFLQCSAYKAFVSLPPEALIKDFINSFLVILFETPSASEGGEIWYSDIMVAYLPLVVGSSIGEFIRWFNNAAKKVTDGSPMPTNCDDCGVVRPPPPVVNPPVKDCFVAYYFSSLATEPNGLKTLDRQGVVDLEIPDLLPIVLNNKDGVPIEFGKDCYKPNYGYEKRFQPSVHVGLALEITMPPGNTCQLEFIKFRFNKTTSNTVRFVIYAQYSNLGDGWTMLSNVLYPAPAQETITPSINAGSEYYAKVLIFVLGGTGGNAPYFSRITRLGINKDIP